MGLKAKMMGGAGSYNLATESAAKRYCWPASLQCVELQLSCACVDAWKGENAWITTLNG